MDGWTTFYLFMFALNRFLMAALTSGGSGKILNRRSIQRRPPPQDATPFSAMVFLLDSQLV